MRSSPSSDLLVTLEGRRFVLHPGRPVVLGRDGSADVFVGDERVSRQHAWIRPDPDGWVFEDLDSSNGSFVDGRRIRRLPLNERRAIRLGGAVDGPLLVFELPGSAGQARSPGWRWLASAGALALAGAAAAAIVSAQSAPPASQSASSSPTPSASALPTPTAPLTRPEVIERGKAATLLIESSGGQGSGVYMGEGRILTAAHVVDRARRVRVSHDERYLGEATIERIDSTHDLALLRIDPLEKFGVRPLEWGDSDRLREGEELVGIGHPVGLPFTPKVGVFAGHRHTGSTDLIQTDATLNQGMSGGAILNDQAQLVGVISFGLAFETGLNFAVASTTARPFFEAR